MESLGEFGRILGEFMRVNESLEEFGRVWESLGEFYTSLGELSRVWESLGEFGRVWESFRRV